MFSGSEVVQGNSTTPQADLPGLDDLQLDMDYDQIMHYFENLKVGLVSIWTYVKLKFFGEKHLEK